jgi:hypothetical protein
VKQLPVVPHAARLKIAVGPKRQTFSCSGDQFDIIVAYAESHGLLCAPFHLVVSEYMRSRLH